MATTTKEKEPEKKDPKAELREKISEVLKEYGGLESNIPHNHEYWNLTGLYRAQ